jgi:hypothetical protein
MNAIIGSHPFREASGVLKISSHDKEFNSEFGGEFAR